MQNTNMDNGALGSTSSLQEERHHPSAKPRPKSAVSVFPMEKRQKVGILQKILASAMAILSGKKKNQMKKMSGIKLPQSLEQPAAYSAPAGPSKEGGKTATNENIARKMAEQQFKDMDVTRTTMN